jgi:hypothetical protein
MAECDRPCESNDTECHRASEPLRYAIEPSGHPGLCRDGTESGAHQESEHVRHDVGFLATAGTGPAQRPRWLPSPIDVIEQ